MADCDAHHAPVTVPSARKMRADPAIALWLVAHVSRAMAQSNGSLSGDYECVYGCRLTDAAPSVAIDGDRAVCGDEFGGLYFGKTLDARSIACFGKVGRLQPDGVTIEWDGGVVWRKIR